VQAFRTPRGRSPRLRPRLVASVVAALHVLRPSSWFAAYRPAIRDIQRTGLGGDRSLVEVAALRLPSAASADQASLDERNEGVNPALLTHSARDSAAAEGGLQPSTSDEDETVHELASIGDSNQRGSLGASTHGDVSRGTVGAAGSTAPGSFYFGQSGGLSTDASGSRSSFGFDPVVAAEPGMTGLGPMGPLAGVEIDLTPVLQARGTNARARAGEPAPVRSAVAAATGRVPGGDVERTVRNAEDPPLAQEAKRAVQILNPSGEITMPRPPRTRTLCVANQKGGVGKTTTVVNIAVALALHGNRVLVVDLDPQGNASTGMDVPHHAAIPDVYDCLIQDVAVTDVVQTVQGIPNLWCVPATIDLAGAEIELVSMVARESRLRRALDDHKTASEYDYIFIDCPPSLGLLTVNALVAAEEVMIPIQCEYYALEGVQQLTSNIALVKSHLNPALEVTTVLLTMYDRRTRLADAVEQDVRTHFGDRVLQSVIPRNVRVSEAPSYGQSVMTYDPGSRGATSYFEAALEIAARSAKLGGGA
jgi:chromosome partitioning protein